MLREIKKLETKQLIFNQAIRLFKEKGYENVKVQEITSACGIAKGTFFNYYAKKEDILLYFGESQLQLLEHNLNTYQNILNPKDKIILLLGQLLKRYEDEGELMKLVISEIIRSTFLTTMESNSIKRLESIVTEIINEAKQEGTFRSTHESSLISSIVVGTYFHTLMTWNLLRTDQESIQSHFEMHLNAVWYGLCDDKEV